MGKQHLVVNSTLTPEYVASLRAPLIRFQSISLNDWVWVPLSKKIIALNDITLKSYIALMGASTYALIFIESGDYSGYHLIYVERGAVNR